MTWFAGGLVVLAGCWLGALALGSFVLFSVVSA